MDVTVIIVSGYVLSVIIAWWLIGKSYRELNTRQKPTEIDFVLMFFPMINIAVIFTICLEFHLKKIKKPFSEWFFRL